MSLKKTISNTDIDNMLAAVDLGSNSFHMIVARLSDDGSLQIIDRLKEMVRLGAGLDDKNNLSKGAQQKAFDCLERFGQRLQGIKSENIQIVGTNTLRKAKNSSQFLKDAQQLLGHQIDIISGIEEARIIYLGVSHTIASPDDKKRLVLDIGGGSTETIIGKQFTPILMESLFMGCVSMTQKFFTDGSITKKQLKKANIFARRELERISYPFLKMGWKQVIGTSGSIRSIAKVIQEEGLAENNITAKAMDQLGKRLIEIGHIDKLKLSGLSEERRPVFVGGFVVLNAIIESLNIESISVSDGSLREGLLYDLLGRIKHEDVRETTIQRMSERYSVQINHANNVANTAKQLYKQLAKPWNISKQKYENLLRWAALLHEIGLTIAHAGYHKHGAYLARNSDMPGFSFQDQQILATLIQAHRQKFETQHFESLPVKSIVPFVKLAVILRFAIILHRSHEDIALPDLKLKAKDQSLKISFPTDWFETHSLTYADLQYEKELLAKQGFKLEIN